MTHTPGRVRGLGVLADAWLNGLASGDQRRLTGSGSALEACSRRYAIQMAAFTLLLRTSTDYLVVVEALPTMW